VANTERRVTLEDVARPVGLSANTVSRALNGKSGVSETTRARVLAAAERLGYVPNAHARSLVLGSRMMVGLVITNASNPFYADLVTEIEQHAVAAGYTLVLLLSAESPEREHTAADTVLRSGLDGVIVVPVQGASNPWIRVQRAGIPVVVVNRDLPELDADFVSTDNDAGAYAATDHVIERGARTVMLLEEDLPISTIRLRIQGFQRAMGDHGLTVGDRNVVAVPTRRHDRAVLPWHADEAYRVAGDLLDRGYRPDAFVVGNDYFALGLYRALGERGLQVPDDTMVVGFGDYPFAEFLDPSLSTVRLPAREVGRRAVTCLLDELGNKQRSTDRTRLMIKPELVVRESTGRVRPMGV
jgi:LacI family transcriptional regulator